MVSAHGSLEQLSRAGRVGARTFGAGVTGRAGVAKQAMPELSQLGGRRRLARPGSGWCGHASYPRPVDPASNSRRRQHACVWQEPGAAGGNGSRRFHADVASRECSRGPRLGSSCDARQLEGNQKMECWSIGVLEYWVPNASLHHSSTPGYQIMSHGLELGVIQGFRDSAIPTAFQSWTLDPWIITPIVLAAGVYVRGWRELNRRRPRRFAVWRLIAFQAGLLTLFLALASPLHQLAELLLQFHMIQHMLLMMVAPPLLLLGAPVLPLLRGLPRPLLQHWV